MSDYESRILENAERFAAPISADAPSGADVAYDVEFESIKTEIDKLTSVSGGQPAWRDVVAKSEPILETRSRDLRLLAWSTVGRLHVSGVDGLAQGLAILHCVTKSQWDTLFPPIKRAKARGNLIDWMNEQVVSGLQELVPTASNGDAIRAVQSLYGEIDSTLSDKLGDAYGGLSSLRSLLRDKVRSIPETPAPVAVAAEPVPTSLASSSTPIVPAPATAAYAPAASISLPAMPSVSGAGGVGTALNSLGEGLTSIARHMRSSDPANASAYRFNRMGLWLSLSDAPPAEDGQTRIRAPGDDLRRQLDTKVSSEQWLDLLNAAEDFSEQYIFWLDLHRYVAMAMDRLGALFMEARKSLAKEVVTFLQRLPAIRNLAFSDGSPFADSATQLWLDEAISAFGGGGGTAATASKVSEEDEELERRFIEARELVTGGKVAEGIGLAAQLAPRAADERRRFRGRLTVAELALIGGKPDVGRPILEGLLKEIDKRKLEDWEPELCAKAVGTLAATYRALGTDVDRALLIPVQSRLCRLDPVAALKWSGS